MGRISDFIYRTEESMSRFLRENLHSLLEHFPKLCRLKGGRI